MQQQSSSLSHHLKVICLTISQCRRSQPRLNTSPSQISTQRLFKRKHMSNWPKMRKVLLKAYLHSVTCMAKYQNTSMRNSIKSSTKNKKLWPLKLTTLTRQSKLFRMLKMKFQTGSNYTTCKMWLERLTSQLLRTVWLKNIDLTLKPS